MAMPANIRVNVQVPFPALVTGIGGIGISKVNGIWTVQPNFGSLTVISSLPNPTTKEVWIFDPVLGLYNVMTLGAVASSIFTDTSTSSNTIGTGTLTFVANPGKAWTVGSWVQIASSGSPTNSVIGQVTAYNTVSGVTSLTVNVPAGGAFGAGSFSSWNIVLSGPPGPTGSTGPTGAVGVSGVPVVGNLASWNSPTIIQDTGIAASSVTTTSVAGDNALDPALNEAGSYLSRMALQQAPFFFTA
jgi:hypothetical protein